MDQEVPGSIPGSVFLGRFINATASKSYFILASVVKRGQMHFFGSPAGRPCQHVSNADKAYLGQWVRYLPVDPGLESMIEFNAKASKLE